MKKRLLLIMCLCLLVGMNAFAYQALIGGIAYNFSGNEATVTYISTSSSTQYSGAVVIPSSVSRYGTVYSVTSIGEGAFQSSYGLTSVTIPESVTNIGKNAFLNCSRLTSLTIPSSVTSIGESAFSGCTGLNSITIPTNVTSLGESAFYNCTSLTTITLPSSLTTISNYMFQKCSGLTSINIPEGVTLIGSYSFSGCTKLSSVIIPKTVTGIASYAFQNCNKLTSVTAKRATPAPTGSSPFPSNCSTATLYVPFGCTEAYRAAEYWQDFGVIEEKPDPVVVGSTGYATFCSPFALDFSGVTDVRAYIASGFNPATGNLLLTRVTEVPGGEGLYIVGTEGSYDVPKTTTSMYYSNLLKGVTTATNISPTDGDMTNFILSNGSYGVGFYPVSSTGELAAGKAYLQLPTALLGNNVKAVNLIFDDVEEDDPTGIVSPLGETEEGAVIYNLAGQRIQKMQKGINIVGGKKIFVK